MIFELRTYTLKAGRMAEYISAFDKAGYGLVSRYAEPVGFWQTGPIGTGVMDQVHHVWAYDSVDSRLLQRSRLYADPEWVGSVMPAIFPTLERLHGQLMSLDAATAVSLAKVQDGSARGAVIAHWDEDLATATSGVFARFRTITGCIGQQFSLRHLSECDLATAAGGRQEIWIPTSFSRIR